MKAGCVCVEKDACQDDDFKLDFLKNSAVNMNADSLSWGLGKMDNTDMSVCYVMLK